jgi:hypothetical protein
MCLIIFFPTFLCHILGEATQEKHHWNKDKFLILYAEPQDEITNETSIHDVWKHTPKSSTREYK